MNHLKGTKRYPVDDLTNLAREEGKIGRLWRRSKEKIDASFPVISVETIPTGDSQLLSAVEERGQGVKQALIWYRLSSDRWGILELFKRHVEFIVKWALIKKQINLSKEPSERWLIEWRLSTLNWSINLEMRWTLLSSSFASLLA